MPRQVKISETLEEIEFVKKVSAFFEEHPNFVTYGKLEEGERFAVRWGLGNDCVLVFTIGDEPRIYAQTINKDKE